MEEKGPGGGGGTHGEGFGGVINKKTTSRALSDPSGATFTTDLNTHTHTCGINLWKGVRGRGHLPEP